MRAKVKLTIENYEYLLAREHQARILKDQRTYLASRGLERPTAAAVVYAPEGRTSAVDVPLKLNQCALNGTPTRRHKSG
jgi:hypothetical protein